MPSTWVTNLATLEKMNFSLPPSEAVMCAFAYANGDKNTWQYAAKYGHMVREGEHGFMCGDWYAFKQ